jgi:hypothetical protein
MVQSDSFPAAQFRAWRFGGFFFYWSIAEEASAMP